MDILYKKIVRRLQNLNFKLLLGFGIIFVVSIISIVINISLHYNQDNINVDINSEYKEEDLNDIEEVRNLFVSYIASAKYDVYNEPQINLCSNTKTTGIIKKAQRLLDKYNRIKIDTDTLLSFDNNSRCITISTDIFTFETDVNVDIPPSLLLDYDNLVPADNGTWCALDVSIPDTTFYSVFYFFQFGTELRSSTIKSDCGLRMIDKRFVNNSYFNHSEEDPFLEDNKFYLFKSISSDKLYIYNTDKEMWKSSDGEVRDVKVTDEFISLITTTNILYMYCIKDSSLFKVGKTEKSLHLDYEEIAYLPDEYTMADIEKLHKCKK